MKNLKDQLAGIAALIAAIIAIGGGFVKYGEVMTKLDAIESRNTVDYSAQIAVLEEKVAKLSDELNGATNHGHTKMLVNEKEIDLLQVQIEEIKVSTSNPLAN
jgi:hypothetical protein